MLSEQVGEMELKACLSVLVALSVLAVAKGQGENVTVMTYQTSDGRCQYSRSTSES